MGGRLHSALPEWNCLCDPEALRLVLSSGLDVTLVAFEQTCRSKLTQKEIDEFAGTPMRDCLREMMNTFTERFGFLPMLHDPMALAMLVKPEIFTFERHQIAVETAGHLTRGALVDYGVREDGNVRVAVDCNLPAFMTWIKHLLMEDE